MEHIRFRIFISCEISQSKQEMSTVFHFIIRIDLCYTIYTIMGGDAAL